MTADAVARFAALPRGYFGAILTDVTIALPYRTAVGVGASSAGSTLST
jgi:hypothetical protein